MKKIGLKKKSLALAAAVVSALEVGSMAGNMWTPTVNVAEAATALSEEERIARGYPKIPNLTYYDDGTVLLREVKHYTYEGDNGSIYGYNAETRASGKLMSYDNDSAVFLVENADANSIGYGSRTIKKVAYSKGQLVASNTSGEVENSSLENEDSLKKKKMFKSMLNEGYSFDQNSASGFVVISPDNGGANPKTVLKKEGVDIEEGSVTISKEMNTKDITTDGKITTTGDIETGGDIHDKGDMEVDGKATLHGDTIIEGSVTTYGDTTIDGTTTLKGDTVIGDSAEDKVIINGTAEFKENTQFDKDVTVKGSQTIEQNLRVKGDSVTEGNSVVKGNSTVEGDATIKGSTTLGDDKNTDVLEVNAKTNIHGDTTIGDSSDDKFTVNATSEFKSDATFDQNVLVKGDQTVEGNSHTKGNAEVDKDLTVHGSEVIDGDSVVHGDSTVDGKFHAKNDAEFDRNVTIHGSETVDGDQTVHGSENVGKDLTVQGSSDLKGDVRMEKDLQVDGNTQLGNDKSKDAVDVYAKTNLHGDTAIGDSDNDKLTVNSTSEFNADATFNKDIHVKGNAEVDKDLRIHGNIITEGDHIIEGDTYMVGDARIRGNEIVDKDLTVGGDSHLGGDLVLDGRFFAKGAAEFGDNLSIAKDLTVGGSTAITQNLLVGGDARVDGDVYGRSFNVGNERYIYKDGINANNHKIRNVADGEIGPDSLDAVNGRQLYHTREALQHNINQVGAGSAAMANLHPLEFEHNDKVSVSAAVGNYKDQTAFAAGVYVRPDTKSLISFSGTLGYGENMLGVGFSKKFGKHTDVENMTDEQLKDALAKLSEDAKDIREQNKALKADNKELSEKLAQNSKDDAALKASTDKQIEKLTSDNAGLKAKLSDMSKDYEGRMSIMSKAYDALQSKVDSLMEKLKNLTSAK